jgi:hypothetical protein
MIKSTFIYCSSSPFESYLSQITANAIAFPTSDFSGIRERLPTEELILFDSTQLTCDHVRFLLEKHKKCFIITKYSSGPQSNTSQADDKSIPDEDPLAPISRTKYAALYPQVILVPYDTIYDNIIVADVSKIYLMEHILFGTFPNYKGSTGQDVTRLRGLYLLKALAGLSVSTVLVNTNSVFGCEYVDNLVIAGEATSRLRHHIAQERIMSSTIYKVPNKTDHYYIRSFAGDFLMDDITAIEDTDMIHMALTEPIPVTLDQLQEKPALPIPPSVEAPLAIPSVKAPLTEPEFIKIDYFMFYALYGQIVRVTLCIANATNSALEVLRDVLGETLIDENILHGTAGKASCVMPIQVFFKWVSEC